MTEFGGIPIVIDPRMDDRRIAFRDPSTGRLLAVLNLAEPPAAPRCPAPCDVDCEVGPAHCENIHLPRHKRSHDPDACPGHAAT